MTSYATRVTLCTAGSAFMGQVQCAAFQVATGIVVEGGSVTNHNQRQSLANRVIQDPTNTGGTITALAQLAASDGSMTGSSADSAVLARVEAVWDACASMLFAQTVTGLSSTGNASTTVATAASGTTAA